MESKRCREEDRRRSAGAVLYLDAAATTYPRKNVLETALHAPWENPSSMYKSGVAVRRRIEAVRSKMLRLLHAKDRSLVFTSGGTEANNAVIRSLVSPKDIVAFSGIDHSSVYECARAATDRRLEIPVDEHGRLVLEGISFAGVKLVCLTHVNNEIGTICDIESVHRVIAQIPENERPLLMVDGVQAFGKLPLADIRKAVKQSDFYVVSAHKIHGLKGVGALIGKKETLLKPWNIGGDQEDGLRAGTENVAGILAFGAAVDDIEQCQTLRTQFSDAESRGSDVGSMWEGSARLRSAEEARAKLLALLRMHLGEDSFVVNSPSDGSPFLLSVSIRGVKSEIMIHSLAERGICVSSASACSSTRNTLSRVIRAIGTPAAYADGTIRLSFAPDYFSVEPERVLTESDLEYVARSIAEIAEEIRAYNR